VKNVLKCILNSTIKSSFFRMQNSNSYLWIYLQKVVVVCVWITWKRYLKRGVPVYRRKNLISCSKSANKPSTSCVRTACPKLSTSLEQAVKSCNNLVDIIRFVARLFQQVRYSHDITILLKSCVVNLVTFLLCHDCIKLVKTTL
jgi:hypothetical protein